MDVRDCGEIHALIAESTNTRNGQRYMCSAHDDSGLLNIFQLRAKLKRLFDQGLIEKEEFQEKKAQILGAL